MVVLLSIDVWCPSRNRPTPRRSRRIVSVPRRLPTRARHRYRRRQIGTHGFPPIRPGIIVVVLESPGSIIDVRIRNSPFPADCLVPPRRINRRSQADRRRRGVLPNLLVVGVACTGVGAPERLGPPLGHGLIVVLAFLCPERTRSSGRIPPDRVCRGQSSLAFLGRSGRLDPLLCSRPTIAPARSRRRADRCRRRNGRFRLRDRGVRTGRRSRRGPVRIHFGRRV